MVLALYLFGFTAVIRLYQHWFFIDGGKSSVVILWTVHFHALLDQPGSPMLS